MYSKTVSYVGFDGADVTETIYFNITETELIRMDAEYVTRDPEGELAGGMVNYIEIIQSKGTGGEIIRAFERLIQLSYGVRSEDGRSFNKSVEAFDKFYASMAYDAVFVSLISDEAAGVEFIRKVLPSKFSPGSTGNEIA